MFGTLAKARLNTKSVKGSSLIVVRHKTGGLTNRLTDSQLQVTQADWDEKTPVEGRAKKTAKTVKWSEDTSVLPSGKMPHDINPVTVQLQLKSGQESQRGSRSRRRNGVTNCQLQNNSAQRCQAYDRSSVKTVAVSLGSIWEISFICCTKPGLQAYEDEK